MRRHIRLVLLAAIKSGCTALDLTPLGCGFDGHPPEEVALMFKREIYRVGKGLPYLQFAVYDDPHKCVSDDVDIFSNFDVFRKILEKPEGDDPNWKSARAEWTYSVMASCDADFPPEERLGDAGGPGTSLLPEPTGEDKTELQTQAGDVLMGTGETASYAKKGDAGGTSGQAPDSSAGAEGEAAGSIGASPVLPAKTSSIISQPSASTQLVSIKKRRPAA